MDELKLSSDLMAHIDQHIKDCEAEMDDDAESIITNQRYAYINGVVDKAVKKKARVEHLTVSDKVDQIVTNRVLALPIFAVIMYLMYSLSMGTSIADGGWAIGTFATDWTNESCSVRSFPTRWAASSRASAWQAGCTADHGRHRRRCRRGPGLRSPDAGPVLPAVHPGGHRLYVPCRLHHGPYLP